MAVLDLPVASIAVCARKENGSVRGRRQHLHHDPTTITAMICQLFVRVHMTTSSMETMI